MNEINKVSIVVAIYNSEPFLEKLINSLICQTYKNIEIILVDDGSPDNSGLICDNYARLDSRIIVIHKTNGGTCEARNFGIKRASGDYLMFVDGDDWLSLDCVEYLLKIAISTNSDMAFSDKIFTTIDQTQIDFDKIEVLSAEKAACYIIYPYMEIGPRNKIYKMSLIRDNNITFSVPRSGEGLYFASLAAQHSNHVGVGHRKVYNYRLNNKNSGLTKYNVTMGINALNNIKFIRDNLYLNTKKLRMATEWHIWKNHYFLLMLIVATNSYDSYSKEFYECKRKLITLLPKLIIFSKVNLRWKIRMIHISFFPVKVAKKSISLREEQLKNDNAE